MNITSSLIKSILVKGDLKEDLCARSIYHLWVKKDYEIEQTDPMMFGSYFETKCLGSGARGQMQDDLPRDKRNGNKTTAHKRIDEQVTRFKMKCAELGVAVIPNENTQVVIYKRWEKNPKIIIRVEIDMFPTAVMTASGYKLAAMDLKLTGDINSTYGTYAWGSPEYMDLIQAVLYTYVLKDIDFDLNDELNPGNNLRELISEHTKSMLDANDFLFRYWVFGYGSKTPTENKFVTVTWDSKKEQEMHESIRKTLSWLEHEHEKGWECNPSYVICKKCPVYNCPQRTEEEIV